MITQQAVLTREGHQKLEQELHHLSTVRRTEVARRLHQALQEGDLLENAGLEDVINERAMLEGHIQRLSSILGNAAIIIDEAGPRDSVGLGSYVTIVDLEGGGAPETYRIVGSAEANPVDGSVSNESPLGRELLGRKAGERVTFDAPVGKMTFRIVGIR